ncbi:MAG TPA: hypothetical protein VIW24_14615 [Aldersonia sp.]
MAGPEEMSREELIALVAEQAARIAEQDARIAELTAANKVESWSQRPVSPSDPVDVVERPGTQPLAVDPGFSLSGGAESTSSTARRTGPIESDGSSTGAEARRPPLTREPGPDHNRRTRRGHTAAGELARLTVTETSVAGTPRAWFIGMNPQLDDLFSSRSSLVM